MNHERKKKNEGRSEILLAARDGEAESASVVERMKKEYINGHNSCNEKKILYFKTIKGGERLRISENPFLKI